MESLAQIAERAKTSTEESARARVTWSQLQELAGAYVEAKLAHQNRQMVNVNSLDTIDKKIQFDLEYETSRLKLQAADDAYHAAMKKYQEQGK